MKRCVFGWVLLAVLLAGSLLVTWAMQRGHEPIARELEQAAEQAVSGNWEEARRLAERAQEDWEDIHPFTACFADHGPMEEIGDIFAQLEVYKKIGGHKDFAAACAELAEKMQAMSDAHGLQWWNLF